MIHRRDPGRDSLPVSLTRRSLTPSPTRSLNSLAGSESPGRLGRLDSDSKSAVLRLGGVRVESESDLPTRSHRHGDWQLRAGCQCHRDWHWQ